MSTQGVTLKSKEELIEKWSKPEVITGSEILLRSLLLEGVDCVFGYPGGAVLYIYDAMHGIHRFQASCLPAMSKERFMRQTAMPVQPAK